MVRLLRTLPTLLASMLRLQRRRLPVSNISDLKLDDFGLQKIVFLLFQLASSNTAGYFTQSPNPDLRGKGTQTQKLVV